MNNKALLKVITVILLGIIAVLAVDSINKSSGEEIADDFGTFTKHVRNDTEG